MSLFGNLYCLMYQNSFRFYQYLCYHLLVYFKEYESYVLATTTTIWCPRTYSRYYIEQMPWKDSLNARVVAILLGNSLSLLDIKTQHLVAANKNILQRQPVEIFKE